MLKPSLKPKPSTVPCHKRIEHARVDKIRTHIEYIMYACLYVCANIYIRIYIYIYIYMFIYIYI